jgi:diaminopropionate ammonia-lyase
VSRLLLNQPSLLPPVSAVGPASADAASHPSAPRSAGGERSIGRSRDAVESSVRELHRRLPGYAPTPLVELPELARASGVGRVLVKAEVERMGLPSFKVLGASWATYRLLGERLRAAGAGAPEWSTVDGLADLVEEHLGRLRLVAATDGNHGRAVARMARLCRLASTILVPEGTAAARIEGIASEGAEVLVIAGTYDDAVRASAAFAAGDDTVRDGAVSRADEAGDAPGSAAAGSPDADGGDAQGSPASTGVERRLVVSDTSWPGYEDVPRWVIEGYSTIFAELDEQLGALGIAAPDVVVVPLGVGALGAAAAAHLRAGVPPREGPLLIGVEPETAACVAAAVEAGEPVELPGPHRSIMAGLNCGLASPVALPTVSAGFGAFVAVDDERCRAAIRALAADGLDVGETGAAALAGLTAVVDEHAAALPLPDDAVVVLLATEGVTDPAGFQAAVGRPPR